MCPNNRPTSPGFNGPKWPPPPPRTATTKKNNDMEKWAQPLALNRNEHDDRSKKSTTRTRTKTQTEETTSSNQPTIHEQPQRRYEWSKCHEKNHQPFEFWFASQVRNKFLLFKNSGLHPRMFQWFLEGTSDNGGSVSQYGTVRRWLHWRYIAGIFNMWIEINYNYYTV